MSKFHLRGKKVQLCHQLPELLERFLLNTPILPAKYLRHISAWIGKIIALIKYQRSYCNAEKIPNMRDQKQVFAHSTPGRGWVGSRDFRTSGLTPVAPVAQLHFCEPSWNKSHTILYVLVRKHGD